MFNFSLDAGLQGLHIFIVELDALNVVGLINSEIRKPNIFFLKKIIDISYIYNILIIKSINEIISNFKYLEDCLLGGGLPIRTKVILKM